MIIDFHAHILPGADHGSNSLETSLAQLRLASEAGVDIVVAQPHFYPQKENLSSFLKRRTECKARLADAMESNMPRVLVGAEVALCRGLENLEKLDELFIEGTNVMLLEMPPGDWTRSLAETVYELSYRCKLILAHVDRYPPKLIQPFMEAGIIAQLNADAFKNARLKRIAQRYIDNGYVSAIGSDIHGVRIGYISFLRAMEHMGQGSEAIMQKSVTLLNI